MGSPIRAWGRLVSCNAMDGACHTCIDLWQDAEQGQSSLNAGGHGAVAAVSLGQEGAGRKGTPVQCPAKTSLCTRAAPHRLHFRCQALLRAVWHTPSPWHASPSPSRERLSVKLAILLSSRMHMARAPPLHRAPSDPERGDPVPP